MTESSGKMIRRISLIVTMVSALAFIVILWIGYAQMPAMLVPAVGFTGVYLWFIAVEIWGVLIKPNKTLSTRYKYWVQEHPVLAISGLILFWVAMTALVVHLGVAW